MTGIDLVADRLPIQLQFDHYVEKFHTDCLAKFN